MKPITVLFEDEDIVVVNKPASITIIPDRSGSNEYLKYYLEKQLKASLWVVHRLDKDTSGVVCFAKNEAAHQHLSLQFEHHTTQKLYEALVIGKVIPTEGTIDKPIAPEKPGSHKMVIKKNGKASLSTYKVLDQWSHWAHVKVDIHTGRTHQVRVHMQSIGHPIVADPIYGNGRPFYLSDIKDQYKMSKYQEEETPLLSRQALHAKSLRIVLLNGEARTFEAPLPKDMAASIKQLHRWDKSK